MKRGVSPVARFLRVALGTTVLLVWAQPAFAIWDLLEQLSGPGPFHGNNLKNFLLTGGCLAGLSGENQKADYGYFGVPPEVKWPATPCFYFDLRTLDADPDQRFFKVDLKAYEFGVTFPIVRPVEVGAGFGWFHFKSNGISKNHFAGTPLRVVFKPLLFCPCQRGMTDKKWLGFLKYYVKLTVIKGMAGEDFGVSNLVFDERNQHNFLTSGGFLIDVLELVGHYKK
jgi:hypothetical protein